MALRLEKEMDSSMGKRTQTEDPPQMSYHATLRKSTGSIVPEAPASQQEKREGRSCPSQKAEQGTLPSASTLSPASTPPAAASSKLHTTGSLGPAEDTAPSMCRELAWHPSPCPTAPLVLCCQ
ncbi:hypothetical protein H1C71_015304 [Ictidomys tridecemlineatus]|nr:hypothetical protein H1C71_015304 [Ictidomys tridecemlineatus]